MAVGRGRGAHLEVDLLGWRRPGTGPALIPAVLALQLRQRLKGGQRLAAPRAARTPRQRVVRLSASWQGHLGAPVCCRRIVAECGK